MKQQSAPFSYWVIALLGNYDKSIWINITKVQGSWVKWKGNTELLPGSLCGQRREARAKEKQSLAFQRQVQKQW